MSRQEVYYTIYISLLLELPYFDPIHFPVIDPIYASFLTDKKAYTGGLASTSQHQSKDNMSTVEGLTREFIPEGLDDSQVGQHILEALLTIGVIGSPFILLHAFGIAGINLLKQSV